MAGYALWQVRDDRGAGVPRALRGARTRVFGLGPEVNVLIPPLKTRVDVRYEWDLGARTRPSGRIMVISVAALVSEPEHR